MLTNLSKDLKQWFETLGYHFENYEKWEAEDFEWIINIPARRGFDRILIRGFEGEIKISDVMAVRESVATHKTDEGWLVAMRRISQLARQEVEKTENKDKIYCYTFDDLLDDVADFSKYFQWLEEWVKTRKIDTNYVDLACTKEEIDPRD